MDWKQAAYPSNLAITAAAVAGAMILAINVFKNRKKMDDHRHHTLRWALALSVLAAACIIGAQLCYYMGDIAEPAMQRFAIAYAPAIAFPAAYFFWRCYLWTRQSLFIPGCLVIVFFLGMSIAGRNPLGKTLVLFREYKSFLNFVQQFPVPGTLVVTGRPGMFTVHGYGAISHETFTNRAKEWKTNMERKLFTNVVMEEFIHYDQVKNPRQELPPEFHTETLYEYQNDAEYYVRFSRILVKDDTGKTSTVNPASVKPNGELTEKGALSKDVFKTDTKSLFGTTKSLFHW